MAWPLHAAADHPCRFSLSFALIVVANSSPGTMSIGSGSRQRGRYLSAEFLINCLHRIVRAQADWGRVEHLLNGIQDGELLPNVYCPLCLENSCVAVPKAGALMKKLLAVVNDETSFQSDDDEKHLFVMRQSTLAPLFATCTHGVRRSHFERGFSR